MKSYALKWWGNSSYTDTEWIPRYFIMWKSKVQNHLCACTFVYMYVREKFTYIYIKDLWKYRPWTNDIGCLKRMEYGSFHSLYL